MTESHTPVRDESLDSREGTATRGNGLHQTEADRLTRALAESYPDQPASRHREVARRILADMEGGES